jgi:pimeloyl-ACP methyl ester carboxylesterase
MKLHYRVAGAGIPIVLTTGLGDTSEVWTGLWEQLHHQARALTWDLRGHGQSGAAPLEDYRPSRALSDLGEMLAAAGGTPDNPAVLIGHSLGGYLSLQWAIEHPSAVCALVLVGTGPGYRDDTARASWNEFVSRFPLPPGVQPAARGLGVQNDSRVIDGLVSIRVPTLVVVGQEDRGFLAAKDYLLRKIPGCQAVVIAGAKHSVHRTHAEQVSQAVLAFLRARGILPEADSQRAGRPGEQDGPSL